VSQKYPGGIISKTAPVTVGPVDGEGGSAPGVWTLTQALELNKQGLWPKPPIPKELYAWGRNHLGQLGINNTDDRSSPVQVGAQTDWVQISVDSHALAIKSNGTLWTWGDNSQGQLGLNDRFVYRSSPVQIGALTSWSQIVTGDRRSFAIKTDGTLWSWGFNDDGQLGLGDTLRRSSPVQVGALTDWYRITAGAGATVALKTNGTMWSWGNNGDGELGQNTNYANRRSSPVQIGALTTWANVDSGRDHIVATKTDGTLWVWGDNVNGQLGINDTNDRSSPVQVGALTTWSRGSGGARFTIALRNNGALWSWGLNSDGELGLGNTVSRSSPVQIGSLTTWSKIAAGNTRCIVIKTDRTMWVWGSSGQGQLGLNDTESRSSPVQLGSLTTWLAVPTQMGLSASSLALKTT
jgi:alpha-tubulin suppressor-like RCC1 family protein